ncbi:MAG: DUF3524 domain-containing protein [Desulfarculaceae bacterium]|jgi:glycosyltransferase involved in cell wall biosynthesis
MPKDELIKTRAGQTGPRLLLLEPYLSASHQAWAQGLMAHIPARWTMIGLPGRFFRWRMRGAAAYMADRAGPELAGDWDGIVCSSMLNLAELRGLCPALGSMPAVAYFHENQLAYPAPGKAGAAQQERDLYLAFSNLTTALAAQAVVFNSAFHRDEFLEAARRLLASLPDARPRNLISRIQAKTSVLPVPLEVSQAKGLVRGARQGPLRLIWNHRWEHDKDPQTFLKALFQLAEEGHEFQVCIMGLRSARWPLEFDQAPDRLGSRLKHLGPVTDRAQYWRWLFWGDVVVSTARQEYQGLAMAEAVWAGCRPLLPRALVYPEIYPERFLYAPGNFLDSLRVLLTDPDQAREENARELVEGFTWQAQRENWSRLLGEVFAKD